MEFGRRSATSEHIPMAMHEVPSGTQVFDWTVPNEWNIRDAYVKDEHGTRVIDFKKSNLHVVGYSVPIRKWMSLAELKEHLHSLPSTRTGYPTVPATTRRPGGSASATTSCKSWKTGRYEVSIDASLEKGHLTYGECNLKGAKTEEVIISPHVCHPSLCNDNLSGIAVATFLARHLARLSRSVLVTGSSSSQRPSARSPGCHATSRALPNIKHGLVLTCLGDPGDFTYKKSRRGDAEIDGLPSCAQTIGQAVRGLRFLPQRRR